MNTWCCRIEVIKSNNWRASFLLTSVPLTVDSKVFKSVPSCVCQKTKTILELFLNYIMMVKHQLNSIQKVLRVCCQSISPFVSCALKFICSQNLNSQYLKRKITDINFWNEFGFSFYSIQCLIRCKITMVSFRSSLPDFKHQHTGILHNDIHMTLCPLNNNYDLHVKGITHCDTRSSTNLTKAVVRLASSLLSIERVLVAKSRSDVCKIQNRFM